MNFDTISYRIEGDDLYVNVVEYRTTAAENRSEFNPENEAEAICGVKALKGGRKGE